MNKNMGMEAEEYFEGAEAALGAPAPKGFDKADLAAGLAEAAMMQEQWNADNGAFLALAKLSKEAAEAQGLVAVAVASPKRRRGHGK